MSDVSNFDPIAFKAEIMEGVKDIIADSLLKKKDDERSLAEEQPYKEVITDELKDMLAVKAKLIKQLANPRMVLLRGQ